jgi:hypothetical protein
MFNLGVESGKNETLMGAVASQSPSASDEV